MSMTEIARALQQFEIGLFTFGELTADLATGKLRFSSGWSGRFGALIHGFPLPDLRFS